MAWSGILYSPYNSDTESVFALNGIYRKRVEGDKVYEWGIEVPDTLVTIAAGDSTGLTNEFNAKYTYARKERNTVVSESNPSDAAAAAVDLTNESLHITAGTPIDGQVNCIRFYRTIADGSAYFHDQDLNYVSDDYAYAYTHAWEQTGEYIAGIGYFFTTENTLDNTDDTTTWESIRTKYTATDNQRRITSMGDNLNLDSSGAYTWDVAIDTTTTDAALGTALHSNHDRPPLGSYVAGPSFNGVCFIIKNNKLYYSLTKQPEYWPASYFIDVGSIQFPGKCIVFHDKQPYFLTVNKIYYISGTAAGSFLPKVIAAKTGTQSQNGAVGVEGYGIFHVGSDGVYLCLPATDSRYGSDLKISAGFTPIFRGETVGGVPGAGDLSYSWLIHWENKLYFGYPGTSDTYPTNILVFYLDEKKVGYYTRGEEIHAVTVDNYNNRLLAVDEGGYSWVIEDKTATDDDDAAITWEVRSKDFTLQTRRHYPRWMKYDVDASDADSAIGALYLDGTSHQTHTLSSDRDTKRRLVTTGNGKRCALGVSGSGPVKIYALESE